MIRTASRTTASIIVVTMAFGWALGAAARESRETEHTEEQPLINPDARVRAFSSRVKTILADAAARSATFRRLVAQIAATDGLVYIAEGQCDKGRLWACLLLTVTIAGPSRQLRILVDPRNADRDLMESIGHELQHAVEVLSDPAVRSDAAILMMYRQRCQLCGGPCRRCGGAFETEEAVLAGHAVRDELEKAAAVTRRN
jgi:hypothetical protein